VAICENSHSVASGSDQGSIHVFRVECMPKKEGNTRYTGCTSIKYIDKLEGSIVEIEHFNTQSQSQSMLVYATTKGKIHGWDLRARKEAWLMENPLNLGLIQAFVIDPQKNWLIVGTSRGFFTCWDIRFNIPIKTWRHPSKRKINKLIHYNSARSSSCIYSSSTPNEVDVWDVETGQCRQLFRVLPTTDIPPIPSLQANQTGSNPLDYGIDDLQSFGTQNEPLIRSLLSPVDCQYLITGGTDKKIRFWDINNTANSYIICGQERNSLKPRYGSVSSDAGLTVYQETPVNPSEIVVDTDSKHKTPLPSVNHHDCILDLKCVELPHRMLLSASRDGVVKVWK